MTSLNLTKATVVFVFFSLLTACGGDDLPVGLETVQPELDETGTMQEIAAREAAPLKLIDSVVKQGVPRKLAATAFGKYDKFKKRVKNTGWITMIDFTQHSGRRRFYMINRSSGKVDKLSVAHGTASDPDKDGYAQYFSNVPNSKKSSLGSYIIAERYEGKYKGSLRLDGLESTNSNARSRAVVIHPAKYVVDGKKKQGWSWGCPAVPYDWISKVISRLRDGSFMYIYGVNKGKKTAEDLFFEQLAMQPGYQWVDESEAAPEDGELSEEELAE